MLKIFGLLAKRILVLLLCLKYACAQLVIARLMSSLCITYMLNRYRSSLVSHHPLSQSPSAPKIYHYLMSHFSQAKKNKKDIISYLASEGIEPPSPTQHKARQIRQESKQTPTNSDPANNSVTSATCAWCSLH